MNVRISECTNNKNIKIMDKNTKITICDEFIQIEHNGEELVFWEAREWGEDGTIVPSIVNAVMLAANDRIDELKELLGKVGVKTS
jgi:hypothetical protein